MTIDKMERIGNLDLWRKEVPGGWLYSMGASAMVFVPTPGPGTVYSTARDVASATLIDAVRVYLLRLDSEAATEVSVASAREDLEEALLEAERLQ